MSRTELLLKQAQQQLGQRQYQAARSLFMQALEQDPKSADAHYGLASACFMQGDFLAAAHHFKETTRHDSARAGAYINLGAIYNRLGRYDDAIATLRRGIDLDPHRGEGYYNLGLVHRHLEHWHLAIEAYKEAVRVSPNMADAHFNLANLLLEQHKYDAAVVHYNHAIRLRPNWDVAKQGLEMAEEARAEQEPPPDEAPTQTLKESTASQRHADPKRDAGLLADLTRLAETADALGRELGDDSAPELDKTIKELASILIKHDASYHEVSGKLDAFRQAAERFHTFDARLQDLQNRLAQARTRLAKA
jgi:tetratricopeptide (TPR) repeat protein